MFESGERNATDQVLACVLPLLAGGWQEAKERTNAFPGNTHIHPVLTSAAIISRPSRPLAPPHARNHGLTDYEKSALRLSQHMSQSA